MVYSFLFLHIAAVRQIRRAQWFLISLPMLRYNSRRWEGLDSNERMLPLRSVEGHCLRYTGGGKRLEQMAKVWLEREFPVV